MVHDGHEFHMRETCLFQIRHQLFSHAAIAVGVAVLIPPPAAQMQFIDRHRAFVALLFPCFQPSAVGPVITAIHHHRSGLRRGLIHPGIRIAFLQRLLPVLLMNGIFIQCSRFQSRHKSFPDTRLIPPGLQGIVVLVPVVELPFHTNLLRIRRPDRKEHTFFPFVFDHMCAHFFPEAEMLAFLEKMDIVIRKKRRTVDDIF